jgi:hypothetical protein
MATTPSSFEALPPETMTLILGYLPTESVYPLERTSKSLRSAVEFNSYLKYETPRYERKINPLQSCGAYSIHHAWGHIEYTLFEPIDEARVVTFDGATDGFIDFALRNCNLLDKPAIYPFINQIKLEVPRLLETGIDVSASDGGTVTFRDVLEGLNRCLKLRKLFSVRYTLHLDRISWKEGTTFEVRLFWVLHSMIPLNG